MKARLSTIFTVHYYDGDPTAIPEGIQHRYLDEDGLAESRREFHEWANEVRFGMIWDGGPYEAGLAVWVAGTFGSWATVNPGNWIISPDPFGMYGESPWGGRNGSVCVMTPEVFAEWFEVEDG